MRCLGSLGLVLAAVAGHDQAAPSPLGTTLSHRLYVGLSGGLFANQLIRFSQQHEFLVAERSNLVAAPALLATSCGPGGRWRCG